MTDGIALAGLLSKQLFAGLGCSFFFLHIEQIFLFLLQRYEKYVVLQLFLKYFFNLYSSIHYYT